MSTRKGKGTNKAIGNSNHASATQAQMLVKALTDFILPMTGNIQNPEEENLHDSTHLYLAPEAQALVEALESFVAAVARPHLNLDDTTKNGEALAEQAPRPSSGSEPDDNQNGEALAEQAPTPNSGSEPDDNPPSQTSNSEPPSDKSPMLKSILEEARHRVFNKMPIRLLAFQKDGSGIELVERGVLWQRISPAIEADFDEKEMESKILGCADEHMRIYVEEPWDKAFTKAYAHITGAFISQHTRYAILSHTWLHDQPGEVTYTNWNDGELVQPSPGYQKLIGFCKIAATNHNVTLGWMDTICINKASSSELDESIRSMYNWYSEATICIIYLARTSAINEMRHDPWFTRGWTLQELLTRSPIQFYAASWKKIGRGSINDEIGKEITAATTITHSEISNFTPSVKRKPHSRYNPISRRMQWAANRQVTREEDAAYSLMGIFGVSISIAYGEGMERAFIRLIKEILDTSDSDVLDVINWGSGPDLVYSTEKHPSSLIPSSPKQYLLSSKKSFDWPKLVAPITLTHLGFRLPVLLMTAIESAHASLAPIGDYYATVQIAIPPVYQGYNVLTKRKDNTNIGYSSDDIVLGVLNFTEHATAIELPPYLTCFAIPLHYFNSGYDRTNSLIRLLTADPVVFDLQRVIDTGKESDYGIPKTKLAKHGLEVRTMYL